MYKFIGDIDVDSRVLNNTPGAKEALLGQCMTHLAKKMYEKKCLKLTETDRKGDSTYLRPNLTKFQMEVHVMTTDEFDKAIKKIEIIENALPREMKVFAKDLLKILTEEPV